MTLKQKEMLKSKIYSEGFDYAIIYYSTWTDIKDKKFHELREKFTIARKLLMDYIGVEE